MQPTLAPPLHRAATNRAAVNRSNSLHSTGPRTPAGKQRASLNALRHGLTARTAALPSEDPAAYQRHIQQFLDEYRPATPTETQLVHELANTAWRLNRIPFLEADLLARAANPPAAGANQSMTFDIVDAHRALATLGLHGQRLSRQFQRTLDQLRAIQAERRERERRDLQDAAALLVHHQHKGIPWDPADDGFVFSKSEVERYAARKMRLAESRHVEYIRFYAPHLAEKSQAATD